jgi:hypothetical protein
VPGGIPDAELGFLSNSYSLTSVAIINLLLPSTKQSLFIRNFLDMSNSAGSSHLSLTTETKPAATATVSAHRGHYGSIPSDASLGLLFLKSMLPALDSLDPLTNPIIPFLSPNARFIVNGGSPIPVSEVIAMLDARAEKLSVFHHDILAAWDVEIDGGKRTVMYESVSVTAFSNDVEKKEVKVPEFNIVELEPMDGGVEGLIAVELRCYMDAKPIMQRVSELGGMEVK